MTDHILYTSSIDLYIRVIPFLIPGLCALVCALFVLLQTKGTRLPAVAYFFTVSILSFSICFAVFSAEVAATVNILRGIFSIFTWGIPVIVITVRHFFPSGDRKASHIESESGRWITACVGAGCALLTGGIVSGFGGYSRLWDIVNIMVTPAGLILLTYYISEQRYPFARETGGEMKSEEIDDSLTRKTLEDYFRTHRPYADPGFKLDDLAATMGVSRSEMSAFINSTFGINFKRFVNRWRLREYERLMSLPANRRKDPCKVLTMAGFTDSRHYRRVTENEQQEQNERQEYD